MQTIKRGMVGPTIELLQSTLKKIGFFSGSIDGIFGNLTYNAVRNFQRNFNLATDRNCSALKHGMPYFRICMDILHIP